MRSCECCILGAGPAGISTAVELTKHGVTDILLVDRNRVVGGLSRTESFGGARFDVGPHRFYTRNREINRLWHETLGDDFIPVDRLTRIHYRGEFFRYPIGLFDVLSKLGPVESFKIVGSFLSSRFMYRRKPKSLEDAITQSFGERLYQIFFQNYTEKVWGIPCSQISAVWATQRIKGLDLPSLIKSTLLRPRRGKIKTLVEQFHYPVLGAGQMYEALCDRAVRAGAGVMLRAEVVSVSRNGDTVSAVEVRLADGRRKKISARHFFTSVPLTHFMRMLTPNDTVGVDAAVASLFYRDHITVNLLLDAQNLFPDQWIYVHDPGIRAARITNYGNFSEKMVRKANNVALSVEYFVFQNEELWTRSDKDLIELAKDELVALGLARRATVENAWVVRETESYPVYRIGYETPYGVVRTRMDRFANVTPIGRGGLFKYNNQDHSMLSGILAARNYLRLYETPYSVWEVNVDGDYYEGAKHSSF
jgi:protoporphyrinogen oxidase